MCSAIFTSFSLDRNREKKRGQHPREIHSKVPTDDTVWLDRQVKLNTGPLQLE